MIKNKTLIKMTEILNNLNYTVLNIERINREYKIIIKDKLGFVYTPYYRNIIRGIKPDKFGKSNLHTIDNIKLWLILNNKPIRLLSDIFISSTNNLKWKCLNKNCNEEFDTLWNSIYSGTGCPYCAGLKVGLSNCLANINPELAKEWHKTKNGDLTPYDVTCGCNKGVWWQCKDNHEWEVSICSRHSSDSKCPYCSGRLSTEDNNLLVCNPELASEWNYKKNNKRPEDYCPNAGDKVWWKCKECNREWEATIDSRNGGKRGCSSCSESKGEKQIDKILNNNNFYNIPHYVFSDCKHINPLEFDFYLPNYFACVEYQGLQHYEPVDFAGKGEIWAREQFRTLQIRDQIKRDYCKKNNIKLIEIPYWNYNNIEEILLNELNNNNINNNIKAGDISA